jgi:hypothetical protein
MARAQILRLFLVASKNIINNFFVGGKEKKPTGETRTGLSGDAKEAQYASVEKTQRDSGREQSVLRGF